MSDGKGGEADNTSCCACCGIAEIDDIKLVPCDGCGLVRYCGVNCQRDHISRHLPACKNREAVLRDELLLKQPENTHHGDCPICCLPLSLDNRLSGMMSCCSKLICYGCRYANNNREVEMGLRQSCPFCREPVPMTEEFEKRRMKRVEANCPVAMSFEGIEQYEKGDYQRAFEYWSKAAELGDALAHYHLAVLYQDGKGVEKDGGKYVHHLEEAAIGGHPSARYNLACHEYRHGNIEIAVKHWIIAATQGQDDSMKSLMIEFREGNVEKEVLAGALRAHKAAVDAMKSSQRREAVEFYRSIGVL